MLILEERVSKTTAELTIAQQAAERRNRALKSTNMELSAVKAELAAAARAAVEADQEINPFPTTENGAFCACRDGGASEARVSVCAMYAPNRLLELSSMTTATVHK